MGCAPSWDVPPHGIGPLMGCAPSWDVPPHGMCPLMGCAPSWDVPPHGRPLMGCASSWDVPPHGMCPLMGCAPSWDRPPHGMCVTNPSVYCPVCMEYASNMIKSSPHSRAKLHTAQYTRPLWVCHCMPSLPFSCSCALQSPCVRTQPW